MIRGQKIEVDLGSDSEDEMLKQPVLSAAFVGQVVERRPAAPVPPRAPVLKNKTGFPGHKKHDGASRSRSLKSTATSINVQQSIAPPAPGQSWEEQEKARIDQENRQRLADMSPEEIEEERRELMNTLSPAFLSRLFAKSDVSSGSNEVDLSVSPVQELESVAVTDKPSPTKSVTFEPSTADAVDKRYGAEEENEAEITPPTLDPLPRDSVHFPRAPQPPDLDPSSETFLDDLHQKYFPSLPTDPDKLEWMQSNTAKNSYDPSSSALNASDIRFDFKGALIPPSRASEIPVTLGLHHHGDAPDAAGYTIAELAHLARSTYPAQRCIAFQTLGRVLYRLSKGEYGDPGEPEQVLTGDVVEGPEDTFGELARGLWREVERLQVIQILVDEGEGRGIDGGRHVSAKVYAQEAVWLWRKGGGRRWKAE